MALHITVGYNAGVPKVLYVGSDAAEANAAYENDNGCERYEILKHCSGIRKGPKTSPAKVQETESETAADESETASAPRRGRPPKSKE